VLAAAIYSDYYPLPFQLLVEHFLTKTHLPFSVDLNAPVPEFSWSSEGCSSSGVAHLSVKFPGSSTADVAILTPANPIPKQPDELHEDVDRCIFSGFLQNEQDSQITITGGCPFENSFEVSIIFKTTLIVD